MFRWPHNTALNFWVHLPEGGSVLCDFNFDEDGKLRVTSPFIEKLNLAVDDLDAQEIVDTVRALRLTDKEAQANVYSTHGYPRDV